jgi:hypothetical protein
VVLMLPRILTKSITSSHVQINEIGNPDLLGRGRTNRTHDH